MTKKSINSDQILETLQLQPISQEEMSRRHILGRLYGPIATFGDATRNGRYYNKDLWTKALNDEIFLEKVACKSLFLELEHPTDRDQIDMKLACACIPEVPKIVGDDLYAVIDILDTPNGKLLKTFVDYGFVPGISSRGSGDVNANDEVDPNTFFLETWDIVSLPAVKKARLSSVRESLNTKGASLKQALTEAYNTASEADKKIMKETLKKINEDIADSLDDTETQKAIDTATDVVADEASEAVVDGLSEAKNESGVRLIIPTEPEDIILVNPYNTNESLSESDDELAQEDEDDSEEATADEVNPEVSDDELTVADIIEDFKTLGEDKVIEFEDVELDGIKYSADVVISEETDNTVVLKTVLTPVEQDEDIEAENSDDETDEEAEMADEEAVDDGDEEVIESLKELVRQKDLLESEVRALKSDKTVSDAKVAALQEALDKYKAAFTRTSELAAEARTQKKMNESLNAKLAEKDKKIAELETSVKTNAKLNESVNGNAVKVKELTEKLTVVQADFMESKTKLSEQLVKYKKAYEDRTAIAKQYKEKYDGIMTHYIVSKAQMLGVRPAEITSRLNESYSIEDVDAACENILTERVSRNRLPVGKSTRVVINESKTSTKKSPFNPDGSYEVDDSLLVLAGLK